MNIPLIQILPEECPFCHGTPVLAKVSLWNGRHGYRGNYKYYVACKNEKCKVNPQTKSYNDIYGMTERECIEKSIEDWNKR